MKMIKTFGNTAGLALVMAVLMMLLAGRSALLAKLDSFFFDIGASLTPQQDIPDKITLITLPVSRAGELKNEPAAAKALLSLLNRMNDVKPAAAVMILEGFPQTIVHEGLIQVQENLETIVTSDDTESNTRLSDVLTQAAGFSEPGGALAKAIQKNNILVAMKINSQTIDWGSFGLDLVPYEQMTSAEPTRKNLVEWLPVSSRFYGMPVIYPSRSPESDTAGYGRVIPLFSNNSPEIGWPMVWQYGDSFLPDLVTVLYHKQAKSAGPVWVKNKGIRFDYYMMHTDYTGRLRPLLLTSGGKNLDVKTFSLDEMALRKNLNALKNRIVLIGADKDPGLKSTALALLSLSEEITSHTPVWAIWLEKGVILLFAFYLVVLLQRLNFGLGSVLSLLLFFLTLTVQWGILVTKGVWLQVTNAMVYLAAGHVLIQFKIFTKGHIPALEEKKHDAFFELGLHYFEKRRLDNAFDALKECRPNELVLDNLYDVGLEYERRQKLKKASAVFEYIDSCHQGFKDAGKRAVQLTNIMEGRVSGEGEGDGAETISMTALDLQRTVLGRYEIERELGRGAMGIVYLGRDPKIGRRVAIKTLAIADGDKTDDHDETMKNRFFREAEAIGRLSHPNIVAVYDVGEEDDLAFIAMDYLTGKSLRLYTDKNNLLPVPTVYHVTLQVAEALAYAHSQNVIHRDIKPGNIIYNEEDDQVKVTDFGIARIMDTSVTTTHAILGSPSFMSPEQLKGSKVDGRADIFSLGVTFFQLLTGQFPFGGNDLATITYQITNAKTPDINDFRSKLPKSASEIVSRALEKTPSKRFQTAAEMAEALRQGAPRRGRKK